MSKKFLACLIAMNLAMSLPLEVSGAYLTVGKKAPAFFVRSGDDQNLSLDMIRGKVIVLFYESRHVIKKNKELKNKLKRLYRSQPKNVKNKIFRLVVIDCVEACFPFIKIWKSKLNEHSKEEGFPIYGDWKRRMYADYRMKENESNFLIIDKQGIIRYVASGKIGNGRFNEIRNLLFELVR